MIITYTNEIRLLFLKINETSQSDSVILSSTNNIYMNTSYAVQNKAFVECKSLKQTK